MSLPADSDTIAAPATPPGRGGICIIRVSGPRAFALASAVAGSLPPPRVAAMRALDSGSGALLDRGLVLAFHAPASFTGEDVVEFHVHGSPVVAALVLQRLVALGAREAGPGEFTRRAFLNGRLDLSQAEAVADLIASASAQAASAALRSLEGEFSAQVVALCESLVQIRVRLEAAMDFPEEGVDEYHDHALAGALEALAERLAELQHAATRGRVLRDGLTLVIAGPPNAGKSSLLNRLAGYDAAIVTELPGTTRDLVREDILLDGIPVRVVDTAGLRDDADRIEAEGIRRARDAMGKADLVLLVTDSTTCGGPSSPGDLPQGVPVLRVSNKIDLSGLSPGERTGPDGVQELRLSALTGAGIDALRDHLKRSAGYVEGAGGAYSARRRHLDALERAGQRLGAAQALVAAGSAPELAAEELRLAHDALMEVTGKFHTEDLLGRIFSEFCIGK